MAQNITLKEALIKRQSIRTYDMNPLSKELLTDISEYAKTITPLFSDVKTKFCFIGPDDIKAIRSWRSPHYIAIYADEGDNALINVGYIYEQLTIYLTSLGLGTCWANSVSPKESKEYEGMKWVATIAFGKEANGKAWRTDPKEIKRRTLADISDKADEKLESARIAPSAMNNQPWYFTHSQDKIRVYCVVQGFMKKWMTSMNRIDIGIALANLKIANEQFKYEVEVLPAEVKGYKYIGTILL